MPDMQMMGDACSAVYRNVDLSWVCDPKQLAQKLELRLGPIRDRRLTHAIEKLDGETWIRYRQEDHGEGYLTGRKTGLHVFRGIAEYCQVDLDELILPRREVLYTSVHVLCDEQIFVPKEFIQRRYWDVRGSEPGLSKAGHDYGKLTGTR